MRILLVEDNDQYREVLKECFAAGNNTVFTAADGAQALLMLETTPVDLVICDIEMPEMRGPELHATLRRDPRFRTLPFLYLTGYSDLKVLAQDLDDSFVKVLNKVTPFREILHTATELASQGVA